MNYNTCIWEVSNYSGLTIYSIFGLRVPDDGTFNVLGTNWFIYIYIFVFGDLISRTNQITENSLIALHALRMLRLTKD